MNYFNPFTFTRALLIAFFTLSISPQLSADETRSSSFGNVNLPNVITPDDVQQCVEPTDVMRRNHMEFLLHQRDDPVIEGIRTKKYSFTGCINCHAQASKDGKIVRAEDPEYFCTSCHQYASVKIDCFECHSDRPAAKADQLSGNFNAQQLLARINSNILSTSPGSRDHKTQLQQVEIRDDK
jgi:predicted CXXCH cytochrome family protein